MAMFVDFLVLSMPPRSMAIVPVNHNGWVDRVNIVSTVMIAGFGL